MNDRLTRWLRVRKVLMGRDFYQRRQWRLPTVTLGNRYAAWTVCPDFLDAKSLVLSFGAGEDVSFDLALMERTGAEVHVFDPSPASVEWISKQTLPPGFRFHPYGLAAEEGILSFQEPEEPGLKSLKLTERDGGSGGRMHALPVKRLSGILEELGESRIDVLKMDIEGAEYEVIPDLIREGITVVQLLVEFHHRFPEHGVGKTKQAIARLNEAGFRIFHVSANGEEFSFVRMAD
ncbi:MAG: FkbM family methyltransferase [Bacteroidales bacterium]